jgi:hypothetical protein
VGPGAGAVTLEEKVDGGNIGISFAADGSIVFQKRAHYVNTASEPQCACCLSVGFSWFLEPFSRRPQKRIIILQVLMVLD